MSLTGKDIAEIAKLLDASHFTALDLTQGEFRLRIRRDGGGGGSWADEDERDAPARAGGDGARAAQTAAPAPAPAAPASQAAGAGEIDIVAPLMGNFYSAPRPGEADFVTVGDRVSEDSIVAIIEVMKLMNSVRAGIAGTVTAVLVENGKAIEQGQPLIRVKVDG